MQLNLEWVDAFVDFADHLNFTHAARARHVSQPTLHGQVRQLQTSVGAPLYHRRGRNLELSEAGRRVAAFGRELRQRERVLLTELHRPQADAPVILQAGEGAYLYLLAPALRRFRRTQSECPGGNELLHLRIGDAEATLRSVEEGVVDVGVLPLALTSGGPERIEAEPLAEIGQMLVVPRTHALAERSRIGLDELTGQRLIVAPQDRPQRRALTAALAERAIAWEVAIEATGWTLMIHLVSLGVGLAVVNDFCRLPRGLVGVPLPELPTLSYAAIRRAGLPVSAASARLWTLLAG